MEPENSENLLEGVIAVFGPVEVAILVSSMLLLVAYIVVAWQSTKLAAHTKIQGSTIMAYSFWFLVVVWLPGTFVVWIDELSDMEWVYTAYTIVTTIPLLTAAYGYRKMVLDLVAQHSEPKS